jgi:murein DD-endopeptidase MepM/ murein hydrolase activator NlpD
VTPRVAFFDSARDPVLHYVFRDAGPGDVKVEVVKDRSGRIVDGWVDRAVSPGAEHSDRWDGTTWRGAPAPEGDYVIEVGEQGGALHRAGTFHLYGHFFPVRGPHGVRGPIGDFGAPRNGGRTHKGFDVTAACGTKLVSVRAGRVLRSGYDPVLDGNFVVIHGDGEDRSYLYAHMRHPSLVKHGDTVRTGQQVGVVGKTGNARTVGCHLHFEVHVHGKPIDPEPFLRSWDRFS